MNDQDEELGYDADHDDPRQYCRHGTFIGSWWGPDYMCWACEAGLTDEEWQDHCATRELDAILSGFVGWWKLHQAVTHLYADDLVGWPTALRSIETILDADLSDNYRRFVDSLAEAPAHLRAPRYVAIATD